MNQNHVPIKGREPRCHYRISLADAFHRGASSSLSPLHESIARTVDAIPSFNSQPVENVVAMLERDTSLGFTRLPCVMGEDIEKLRFNLLYQDSRVKTQLEGLCQHSKALPGPNRTLRACLNLIASALAVPSPDGGLLWQKMNDNDLDALVFSVLEGCDAKSQLNLLRDGFNSNQLALDSLPSQDAFQAWSLYKIMELQVFAGTVWWSHRSETWNGERCDKKRVFGIDDRGSFLQELRRRRCGLVFFSDDNGELVWDLLLTQVLLEAFPQMRVKFVTNSIPVANNANDLTLQYCLNHPRLAGLRKQARFRIFLEENLRSSLETQFFSRRLMTEVKGSDLALLKGVGLFETAQRLPLPAFYAFVVHSMDSEIITGLTKGNGVFVRIAPNSVAYQFRQQTLLEFRKHHPSIIIPPASTGARATCSASGKSMK